MKAVSTLGHLILIATLLVTGKAMAQLNPDQNRAVDEAARNMLIELANDPAFDGVDINTLAFELTRDEEQIQQFGAVLDVTFDDETDQHGLAIVAITPDSLASDLGLKSADRIQAINGKRLLKLGQLNDGRATAYERFATIFSSLENNQDVELTVLRQQQTLVLHGRNQRQVLPAIRLRFNPTTMNGSAVSATTEQGQESGGTVATATGCGSINSRQPPPNQDDIWPVAIVGFNTETRDTKSRDVVYIRPGEYRVLLKDYIPNYELRTKHTRFSNRRPNKNLTITVEDGMVYYVGAKLLYSIKDQGSHDEYWEPVIWKSESLKCLGKPIEIRT